MYLKIAKNTIVPYPPQQMYQLVNDIPSYPEFIPWCRKAKILAKDNTSILASLELVKGPLKTVLVTRNQLDPANQNIHISLAEANHIINRLTANWHFILIKGGCEINFQLSLLLNRSWQAILAKPILFKLCEDLIILFKQRALTIGGSSLNKLSD